MRNRFFILSFFLTISIIVKSQTDTLFWFAVPYATLSHDGPLTADLTLSATDPVNKTTVTISQPYNPQFSPITVTIDPAVSLTQNVNFTEADLLKFSNNLYNSPSNTAPSNSALLIRSDRKITAYYEIHRTKNNPAIFALKGKNALGNDFWTPFQTHWNNNDYDAPGNDPAFSQIIIVATMDNTIITVNFKVAAYGYAANTNYNITLHKGQTYMFVPRADPGDNNEPSIWAADRLVGTHITSNRPIAVTLGDDSVLKSSPYDYLGDQHIPVINAQNKKVIGYEYVIMRGKVSDGTSGERVYILTTEPTNTITVTHQDGTVTTYSPANAGQQVNFTMPLLTDHWAHISSLKPIYVLHIAGFGNELGEAVLPSIDGCTGSLSVNFTRSKTDDFYLNLMTKADAIDSFYISIDGGTPSHFLSNPNLWEQAATSGWYVLKDANKLMLEATIPTGKVTRIFNTKNVFQLGYFNGKSGSGGCVYGYFSDYNELEASANVEDQGDLYIMCDVDSVQLKATGGLSYRWSPSTNLNDSTAQNPIYYVPKGGGVTQDFKVKIEQPCNGDTTFNVRVIVPPSPYSFLTLDYNQGCAPLTLHLTDASSDAELYRLDPGNISIVPPEITVPLDEYITYENNSDTIINYYIKYSVGTLSGCYDDFFDTITVYPEIISGFEPTDLNDTTVCNSITVPFNNLSTGNTENFEWYFGDGSTSSDTLSTSHTYTNFSTKDTVYHAYLVAISPYGCHDTSYMDIRVYPYIYTSFTVDSATVCSPADIFISPIVSVGVETFYWYTYDVTKTFMDNSFTKANESPFSVSYANPKNYPDTLLIEMYGSNQFGCYDSATTRQVIVYPDVIADFTINPDAVCDSSEVRFTNNSSGFDLVFEWDFANGTTLYDITGDPFTRYFLNRSTTDTNYVVKLTTTSANYFCRRTHTDTLTVHPFINANFAIDYGNNCSPLNVEFTNTTIGGDVFDWDFGDGNTYNTLIPETLFHNYENNTDNDTTFYIKLITSNFNGCTDSMKRSVFLFPQVVAGFDFNSPNQGCNPLSVTFTNNSKGLNLDYFWDFGDKTYSASQNPPPRIYKNSTDKDTTYHVNLTVMNLAGCDSSITQTVEVYSKVTADFSVERVDSCSPFKIRIDNFSSGGITEFIWKYTENDSVTLFDFSNPIIPAYHNTGLVPVKYPLILRTSNIHDCQAAKKDTITVFPEMHADFDPDTTKGCQPLPVSFTNNSNIKTGTSFKWEFGDGNTNNWLNPPEHLFKNLLNTSALYDVRLSAETQYGCTDDTTIQIEVHPYIFAKFTMDRPAICSDELFTIDRTSSAGAIDTYKWFWDYQNNPITFENEPDGNFTHTYPNYGAGDLNRTIKLTVSNLQGCDTSWTEHMPVHPQVRASFNVDNEEICYPKQSAFYNTSSPAIPMTYDWDFGDLTSSAGISPSHSFKNFSRTLDESFLVKLTATSQFGCDSTISKVVTVHPKPMADFEIPVAADCPPFLVNFTNNSLGLSLDYQWDFANGETSTETNPSQSFSNINSFIEDYPVSLIVVTDFNCSDTTVKPVTVYPEVNVNFEASEWFGCNPLQINLDGTSSNENEFYWYVDNKVVSNYEDPSYRFINESAIDKTFDIKFKAISINGCTDDITKQITIYPKPLAEFLPDPQAQDFNTETDITPVTLNNQTNNQSIWQYKWNYGDGTTSTQSAASFIKNYLIWGDINNENRIPVTMIAINSSHPQCSDTIIHFVMIEPPLPKVDLGDDVSGCMPLTVEFPSTTKYIYTDSYQWDLGYLDQASTEKKPDAIVFDTAGTYIVRLAVAGDGGTNWDYKVVKVYPQPVTKYSFTPDSAWVRSQTEPGKPIMFINLTDQALSYTWDFGDDSPNNSEFQPVHEYMNEGLYTVTLTAENEQGCVDTYIGNSVLIMAHGELRFPNVITITPGSPAAEYYDPDGYQEINIFRPVNEGIDKYKLEIYNRWGELIFESDEVTKGWNGFIKGSPVKQDVYVWRVTATFTNGRPYIDAGDVTVLVRQH